jgi:hypothetical protein
MEMRGEHIILIEQEHNHLLNTIATLRSTVNEQQKTIKRQQEIIKEQYEKQFYTIKNYFAAILLFNGIIRNYLGT